MTTSAMDAEREVEASRGRLDQTMEALRDKMTPGQLFDEAMHTMGGAGSQIASKFVEQAKENPLPLAVMGLGLAWLMSSNNRSAARSAWREPRSFAYDGDDSDHTGEGPGPAGSAPIEAAFVDYLSNQRNVPVEGTDFDGRSDYGPFIAAGIPAGGLFTGAEEIKTPEQVAKWGGAAGVAYDKCYHQACDTVDNVDLELLERMADAVALAVFGDLTDSVR